MALSFLPEIFQRDREVVLAAVRQEGAALAYAHDDRKKDIAIVRTAVHQNAIALDFVPAELQEAR